MRPALRRPPNETAHREEKQMLKKLGIASIAATTLLASPAFAAWPLDRAAQAEQIGDQRIICEIVVDGAVMEPSSDAAPANELRPTWVDERSVFDRPYQHSW
jgi:hypothetical protein